MGRVPTRTRERHESIQSILESRSRNTGVDSCELPDEEIQRLVEEGDKTYEEMIERWHRKRHYELAAIHTGRVKELGTKCDCKYCVLEDLT